MKHLAIVLLVLGVVFAPASCTRQESYDVGQIRKSIEEVNASYGEAIREGNLAGVVAAYTDDATMVPPDGDLIKGKQAIEEFYRRLLQMGVKDIVLTTIEVEGSGGTAYEIGKTKIRIQPEGQETTQDSTKYMVIWKRQADGKWKVQADIWNLSSR